MPQRGVHGKWIPVPGLNVHPDTMCWSIPYTGEAFAEYEQFVDKVRSYNKREWSCSLTARKGLNLEEALLSEKLNGFPESHKEATLRAAHCNTDALLKIVADVYDKFKTEFMPGETTVQWKVTNRRKQGSAPYVAIIQKADTQEYIVEDIGTGNKQCVSASALYRRQPPLLKDAVKQYIRDSSTRDSYKDAPHMVNPELVAQYGLKSKLTKAQRDVQDEYRIRYQKMQATIAAAGGGEGESDNALITAKARAAAFSKSRMRYPIDDALLTMKDRQDEGPWCTPSYTFTFPQELVREALPIWDFLIAFGNQIYLSKFDFEQFQYGLAHCSQDNTVFAHSMISLLTATAQPSAVVSKEKSTRGPAYSDRQRGDPCPIDGCPNKVAARGVCAKHDGYKDGIDSMTLDSSDDEDEGGSGAAAAVAAAAAAAAAVLKAEAEKQAAADKKAAADRKAAAIKKAAADRKAAAEKAAAAAAQAAAEKKAADAKKKPFECEYGCGFDGATVKVVEKHEKKCPMNPAVSDDIKKPFECEYGCGFDGATVDVVEDHEQICPMNPNYRKGRRNSPTPRAKAAVAAAAAATAAAAAAAAAPAVPRGPSKPRRRKVTVALENWEVKVKPWLAAEIGRASQTIAAVCAEAEAAEVVAYCKGECSIDKVTVKGKLFMLRLLSDAAVATDRIHAVLSTNVEDVRLLKVEQRAIKLEYNNKKRAEKAAAKAIADEQAEIDAARKAKDVAKRLASGETAESIAAADAAAAVARAAATETEEAAEAELDEDQKAARKYGIAMPTLPSPAELEGREGRRRLGDYKKAESRFHDLLAKYRFEEDKQRKSLSQTTARQRASEKARIDAEDEEYTVQYNSISLEILQTSLLRRVPLGKDRCNNHYWVFWHDPSRLYIQEALPVPNPANGPVKVEKGADAQAGGEYAGSAGRWGVYTTIAQLDTLFEYLNEKGTSEKELKKGLEDYYSVMVDEIRKREKVEKKHAKVEDGANMAAAYTNEFYLGMAN